MHIDKASGGILFVYEAYKLMPIQYYKGIVDFGKEALEEIMSSMDTNNIIVIFATYSKPNEMCIRSR